MSDLPFPDNAWLTYREATQRWGAQTRKDQTEYIRRDLHDAALAAAKAEGMREGMLKAAGIIGETSHWSPERPGTTRNAAWLRGAGDTVAKLYAAIRAAAGAQP